MRDPKGFLTLRRATPGRQAVEERVRHWREFYGPVPELAVRTQAARCMDCGVPFCQGDTGCPVRNIIPEWNDLVSRGEWRDALDSLHATNNFPELTGRLCPAPCESACVLGLVNEPVTIRHIEQTIADRGFAEGWVMPRPPRRASGFSVAVVGSGPAGLAAAQQLRRFGHDVVVFEKDERVGGLLRYGIPEFKLEKSVLDLRLSQLEAEGVRFRTGIFVGDDVSVEEIRAEFDAVCVATGAGAARDLDVPGRGLGGVHLAMEFLTAQNRRLERDAVPAARARYQSPVSRFPLSDTRFPVPATGYWEPENIDARDRRVVIIGGGDTGSDCAGTCVRQGARSVRQFELLPAPPASRAPSTPWPLWPMQLRTSHAHEEGCDREWNVATTAFSGQDGRVRRIHAVRLERHVFADGRTGFKRMAGTEFELEADLVLLAMGFTGPVKSKLLTDLAVELDGRGNIATDDAHRTSVPGVFSAGDARRGASLIVWAIREGRDAAESINSWLRSRSLPTIGV
ncbi:MAG: glutamate synthase subunit beta [Gemmatimonadota bacterium]|nr:glutamate synthase subunit beta [Gemmatimonadota bacterium]